MRYYAQRYLTQINDLLENVPSSLLLLLKTNDCLRQLDKSVGRPMNTLTGQSSSLCSGHPTLTARVDSCVGNNLRGDL
jgi:hypothetical protein